MREMIELLIKYTFARSNNYQLTWPTQVLLLKERFNVMKNGSRSDIAHLSNHGRDRQVVLYIPGPIFKSLKPSLLPSNP